MRLISILHNICREGPRDDRENKSQDSGNGLPPVTLR